MNTNLAVASAGSCARVKITKQAGTMWGSLDLVEWVTLYCEKCKAETKHDLSWERKKPMVGKPYERQHARVAGIAPSTTRDGEPRLVRC